MVIQSLDGAGTEEYFSGDSAKLRWYQKTPYVQTIVFDINITIPT
ncbi:MAG TPA: hypothetical protein VJ810_41415 [Blastocatellia bacterium]|nr:hypothetical protein [Blastocatellia bacterium]